ncbi:MAG: DUF1003 domain-containing protein [Ilumatobacteraceae bacterium]|nr:DUF1003 domain-containing protein [Ilumatobacteraceae bacterium]
MSDSQSSNGVFENGCAACAIVDKLDGKVDGKLFNLAHWSITAEHKRWQSARNAQDKAADKVTRFAGSLNFVYIHAVWFTIWVSLNVGAVGASLKFDKYPFGLLTMLVSLEAIFLSTFVMVSQNRQAARADSRSKADFEANIQSLIWSVHIGQEVGLDIEHVETLCSSVITESRNETGSTT